MTLVFVSSAEAAIDLARSFDVALSASEKARALGYRSERARELFIASHSLALVCLSEVSGCPLGALEIHQRCDVCGGAHGKPIALGPFPMAVSISHARDWVAVAAVVGNGALGVDLEPLEGLGLERIQGIAPRVLSHEEIVRFRTAADPQLEFLRMWVRKESLIKAGLGSLDDLANLKAYPSLGDLGEGIRLYSFQFDRYVGAVASSTPPTYRFFY